MTSYHVIRGLAVCLNLWENAERMKTKKAWKTVEGFNLQRKIERALDDYQYIQQEFTVSCYASYGTSIDINLTFTDYRKPEGILWGVLAPTTKFQVYGELQRSRNV